MYNVWSIHLLIISTDFTGYVVFIITSFLAGVESADQCLLNSKVLSYFSGVIMSIRSFFLYMYKMVNSKTKLFTKLTNQCLCDKAWAME